MKETIHCSLKPVFIHDNDQKLLGIVVEDPVGMGRLVPNKKNPWIFLFFIFFVLKMNTSLKTGQSHEENEKGDRINFREVQDYGCSSFKTWCLLLGI